MTKQRILLPLLLYDDLMVRNAWIKSKKILIFLF